MTLARMTTARRQIISSASQSLGRNGPPGDSTSRRPAAEGFIGHPLDGFWDRPGRLPPGNSRNPGSHAIRSSGRRR